MTMWRKSSYSSSTGGNCVELAKLATEVGIRDSKNPAGGHLTIPREGLEALVQKIKDGSLDF